jgi:hypothetical protein
MEDIKPRPPFVPFTPDGYNPRPHGGEKHDAYKSRVELLDPQFQLAEGDVAALGALKYADENWRKFDDPMPFLAAAERHLLYVRMGVMVNEEDSALYKKLLLEKKGITADPVIYHAAQAAWNMRAAWWCITVKLHGVWNPPGAPK